jgi:hypothetical protein
VEQNRVFCWFHLQQNNNNRFSSSAAVNFALSFGFGFEVFSLFFGLFTIIGFVPEKRICNFE